LFHALLLHVHFTDLPHKGTEATLARIRETLWPVGRARICITRLVQTCSKCRLILQRTVERELADLPDQRTTMAPPFYAIQIDIAMGFKARLSNESKKCFPA
jgi:hypothetical protein